MESGGIALFDLVNRRRFVVNFTPRPLYPQEKSPGTHWIGGLVGSRAGLDAVSKREIPSSHRESKDDHPIVQPVASRYIDWAIPAMYLTYVNYSTWLWHGIY
jgi:hypothetical protein